MVLSMKTFKTAIKVESFSSYSRHVTVTSPKTGNKLDCDSGYMVQSFWKKIQTALGGKEYGTVVVEATVEELKEFMECAEEYERAADLQAEMMEEPYEVRNGPRYNPSIPY